MEIDAARADEVLFFSGESSAAFFESDMYHFVGIKIAREEAVAVGISKMFAAVHD